MNVIKNQHKKHNSANVLIILWTYFFQKLRLESQHVTSWLIAGPTWTILIVINKILPTHLFSNLIGSIG